MTVWFSTQEKNKRQLEFVSIWLFEVHFSKCNLWMLLVKHASKFLHLMGKDSAAKVREKMKVESSSSSGKKSLQEDRWHHQRQHTLNTTAKLSVNWTYWIHYFFYCIDKKAKKVFFWVIIHCWLCPPVQIANWGIYSTEVTCVSLWCYSSPCKPGSWSYRSSWKCACGGTGMESHLCLSLV